LNETLLLLSAGQGTLLSFALISAWFKSDYFRFFLGLIFFVIAIELWSYWGFAINYIQNNPVFPYWDLSSYLLLPPAVYWVFKIMRAPYSIPSKRSFLIFIPAVLEIFFKFLRFYIDYFFDINIYSANHIFIIFLTQQLPILWLIIVLIVSFQYKKAIKYYTVYGLLGVLTLLWIIDYLFPVTIFTALQFFLMCILFVFGYLAYLYPRFFDGTKTPRKLDLQFEKYDHKAALKVFEEIIIENKGYSQPSLSLGEVAKKLKVPSKYLSYLINKHYKTNFKSFINTLRVQEIITNVNAGTHKHMTLLGIAMEAGFNSKSSFNTIFKEQTGKSPSNYFKEKNT